MEHHRQQNCRDRLLCRRSSGSLCCDPFLRINIIYEAEEEIDTETKRIISQIIKQLKNMKQKGSIQFFATEDSFRLSSTEVVFLQNKYPAIFSGHPSREGETFVFVKL